MIVRPGAWRPRAESQFKSEGCWLQNFLFFPGGQSFPVQASSTIFMECHLLYSRSAHLNVSLIQKTPSQKAE